MNTGHAEKIVKSAIGAATADDAEQVQALIATDLGGRYERPIADTWNNHGLMSASGNYDYKLIELVTNMQDAVLERSARNLYGSDGEIPFTNPFEAANDLFGGRSRKELSELVRVEFRESDGNPTSAKRLTAVFRDHGCGLSPHQIPRTVFRLGGSHKEDALYLQGAFGMGGAMTYRNAQAVVLVSRRDPKLLEDEQQDRISVAVVEWKEHTKGSTAQYLVDRPWAEPGDTASPWSCLASEVPDFEPGTHIALISYGTDGIQRKTEMDDRTFPKVLDTRLFRPVLPVLFTNKTDRGRQTALYGLEQRLENLSGEEHVKGTENLPFRSDGTTSQLPVSFTMFKPRRSEGGGRIDSYVAAKHAVIFTSNGQVHHHWDADELRRRTGFNKIHDRIVIVVETDELPIRTRTSLFTPDRNNLVRTNAAIRLEDDLAGFLKDWDALREQNNKLIRESLQGSGETLNAELGRRIGRAFAAKGFGGGAGSGGPGGKPGGGGLSGGGKPGRTKPINLHPDPTKIEGPSTIEVEQGTTRSVRFVVDVEDSFWDGRGQLVVSSAHPNIGDREITVGRGRAGSVRVMIAIPDDAELGVYELNARLTDWHRRGGGLGPELSWTTKMNVVTQIGGAGAGNGRRSTGGTNGAGVGDGTEVVVQWSSHNVEEKWGSHTVGEVDDVEATVLAGSSGYAHLAALGTTKVPVIRLNETYTPLKEYLNRRSKQLTDLQRPKDKYALGTGLALLRLHKAELDADNRNKSAEREVLEDAMRAAAMGVLAVMPEFDSMLQELGGRSE